MSYENAPSTKMLASNCAVCARPLRDAVSVEAGMGPDCRERHGYFVECDPDIRARANQLIHFIACEQTGIAAARAVGQLAELGFTQLANRIKTRIFSIHIRADGDRYSVVTPYTERGVEAMKAVPGRRWDATNKVNTFPRASRMDLWRALQRGFPGYQAIGPEGQLIEIPA